MSEEKIGLYRDEDETWYEAGIRFTAQSNLEGQFEDYYYDEIRNGEDDFAACMIALEELGFAGISEEHRDDNS
jgi:hypothetical protein